MEGSSIYACNLCIKEIRLVLKNTIPKTQKRIVKVSERKSDAFVLVLKGSCSYLFGSGEQFVAREGDVFYLPYKSVYTMKIAPEDYSFIYCDFDFLDINALPTVFNREKSSSVKAYFLKLLNLYKTSPVRNYAECMSVLYAIYAKLKISDASLSEKSDTIAVRGKEIIDECFTDPNLSIDEVAGELKISGAYFRRIFARQYGSSPIKYLSLIRLNNAKKLMEYPFLNLETCAKESGFSSLQYFSRVFKKEFGISPGQYRQGFSLKKQKKPPYR